MLNLLKRGNTRGRKGSKEVKLLNVRTGKNANSVFGTMVPEGHSPDPPEAAPSNVLWQSLLQETEQ